MRKRDRRGSSQCSLMCKGQLSQHPRLRCQLSPDCGTGAAPVSDGSLQRRASVPSRDTIVVLPPDLLWLDPASGTDF